MRVAADHARLALGLAAVAIAIACKAAPPGRASELADDLAQIEAELQRSDARLGDAGIVVAYREPASSSAGLAPAEEVPVETPPPDPRPEPNTPTEPTPPEPRPTTTPPEMDAPPLSNQDDDDYAMAAPVEREKAAGRSSPRSANKGSRSKRRVGQATRTRCERVCDLSETTCDLQIRICDLAAEHPDDVRYEDACRRAEDQCEAATRSCESCAV